MKLIAFTGYKGSGKTLASDYLSNYYGIPSLALARPMKDAAQAIFGWDSTHTDGPLKEVIDEEYGISPRQFLQNLGTEYFQFGLPKAFPDFEFKNGRLFWCKALLRKWNHLPLAVVQDLRFRHEAEFFSKRAESCFIIRITRPGLNMTDVHPSEAEGPSIPATAEIINDKTVNDLFDNIDIVMATLGIPKKSLVTVS